MKNDISGVDNVIETSKYDNEEHDKMNSFNSYVCTDPNDPQNILSKSLRAIVNNNQEEEDQNLISVRQPENSNT